LRWREADGPSEPSCPAPRAPHEGQPAIIYGELPGESNGPSAQEVDRVPPTERGGCGFLGGTLIRGGFSERGSSGNRDGSGNLLSLTSQADSCAYRRLSDSNSVCSPSCGSSCIRILCHDHLYECFSGSVNYGPENRLAAALTSFWYLLMASLGIMA
jgi:hypothetical protein